MIRKPWTAVWMTACVSVGFVCLAMAQSKPVAADAPKVHAGQQLFMTNCMACHATVDGQTSLGPNLFHVTTKPSGRRSVKEIETTINDGKGKMPAFHDRLSAADIENLAAYLRTL